MIFVVSLPIFIEKVSICLFIICVSSYILFISRYFIICDTKVSERYECAKISNQFVDLPKLLQYTREIYVTYVDEDVLVIRNNSGVPEMLIRSGKLFTGLNL